MPHICKLTHYGWLLILTVLASETACVKPVPPAHVFRMGEKVPAGPLIFTVFQADWLARLGEGSEARIPSRRFLMVRLSVTNSGSETLSAPGLSLVDDAGHFYSETIDGRGIPSWWGLMRKVKPADTLEGNILFDVEPRSYKLKLDDDSDPARIALVEMPLRFSLEQPAMPSALDTPVRP